MNLLSQTSQSGTVRVVLADDHPIVRTGICNLLLNATEIEVVGEASNGTEALAMIEALEPDVLLLDMEMPDIAGVDIARRMRAIKSNVRILALSAHNERQYILSILEHGAAGYLTKDEAPQAIIEAVIGVARGESGWLSRKVAASVSNWMQEDAKPGLRLTPREADVLLRLSKGLTNQRIALDLGISEKTVEKYLDSLFKKLEVSSRVDAAVRAVRENLV